MRRIALTKTVLATLVVVTACDDPADLPTSTPNVTSPTADIDRRDDGSRTALSGGATTVFDVSSGAFENPAPNLSAAHLARHDVGDEAFGAVFVPAPAPENGGLGPVFNNVSCEACHLGDGRGRPPLPGERFETMLFRASVPGRGPHRGPAAAPGFGTQLQLEAIPGFRPEVDASVTYTEAPGRFADGTAYSLRVPRYSFRRAYVPLPPDLLVSPRVAPAVFGLGLLEAVPDIVLLANADPDDRDRDGISGRVNVVWDEIQRRYAVGRFGWKANVPNLMQQTAGAYNGDMGVTSTLFPAESCEGAVAGCERHGPEVDDATVADAAFYTQTLGVPARRDLDDPQALAGERLFRQAGCAGCHLPTAVTGVLPGVPEVSGQRIHAYTDLLLHDMGPALADGRPDFRASGSEWRTPPLWGIGLVKTVNGHTNFLHDGRARSLLEAVLWHGGEAAGAREAVRRMSASSRLALLAFLESL
jgi:CxxC motif-containing protein (DUF1111 family)